MKALLLCLVAALLCRDLARALQCYSCKDESDHAKCNEVKECPQGQNLCKISLGRADGKEIQTRDCASNCDPNPAAVYCCDYDRCNNIAFDPSVGGHSGFANSDSNANSNSIGHVGGVPGLAITSSSTENSASSSNNNSTSNSIPLFIISGTTSNFTANYIGPVSGSSVINNNSDGSSSSSSSNMHSTGGSSATYNGPVAGPDSSVINNNSGGSSSSSSSNMHSTGGSSAHVHNTDSSDTKNPSIKLHKTDDRERIQRRSLKLLSRKR